MILTAAEKYIFGRKANKYKLIFFFLFGCIFGLQAQKYSLQLDSIPLSEALTKISNEQGLNFAFDASKLNTVFVKKKISANTPDEFIKSLLENTGFEFVYKHGTYLITENSVKQPEQTIECQVIGTVTERESGEQLAFATISFPAEKVNLLASTNGSFYYKRQPGRLYIRASYIGYYPLDTIIELKKPVTVCDLKLKRQLHEFDTVVVKGGGQEMIELRNDVDFATTVNMSKLTDLPQFSGSDVFRTMQLMPGINYTETSAELSIRGGSSDQNLVLYDGQTLYNLSHFFGMFSALNPSIIKDIQIYKGGFDSRYGERVSGIVDITSKSGSQVQPSFYGDINLISASLATEIPVTNKLTLVAAGRRSYSDMYSTGLTQSMEDKTVVKVKGDQADMTNQSEPVYYFYDYNVKLSYRTNTRENIAVSVYGGSDSYQNSYFSKNNKYDISTSDQTYWGNYGMSGSWQRQWHGALYSNVLISSSGYSSDYTNATDVRFLRYREHPNHKYLPDSLNNFNTNSTNDLSDRSIQLRNIWYVNRIHQVNFGLSMRSNKIEYHKDADKVYVYDSISQSSVLLSAYAQDKINLGRFTLKPGLRVSHFNSSQAIYFEPRISVNFQVNDFVGVRAAAGNYYQFISKVLSHQETGYYKSFWMLSDGEKYPVLQANHIVLGSSFEKGRFLFDIEAYYKSFSGIQEYIFVSQFLKNSDFNDIFKKEKKNDKDDKDDKKNPKSSAVQEPAVIQPSYFIDGNGTSKGMDFWVRYKYYNFTSWLGYSLGNTVNQFAKVNNGEEFPAITDQAHQLSLTNMFAWRKWNFGSVVLFSSGRPYYIFDNFNGRNQQATLKREVARMDNYFRTDLSMNYSFRLSKIQFKLGATLINLFNSQNYFDVNNRKFDFDNALFSETNLVRSQGRSVNVFLVFRY